MSRNKPNKHSPNREQIWEKRKRQSSRKRDGDKEGHRARGRQKQMCFWWRVEQRAGRGSYYTSQGCSSRSPAQLETKHPALPAKTSQSPRCILIDCNCQLTACSGSGYCTLTFIIFLVLSCASKAELVSAISSFHYKTKSRLQCYTSGLNSFQNTIWHTSSQCHRKKKNYAELTFGRENEHSSLSDQSQLKFETAAC